MAWGRQRALTLRSKSTGQKLKVALVDERGRVVKRSDVDLVLDPKVARDTDEST